MMRLLFVEGDSFPPIPLILGTLAAAVLAAGGASAADTHQDAVVGAYGYHWGYHDHRGRFVLSPKLPPESDWGFSEGLAAVEGGGPLRVVRGGSWKYPAASAKSALRNSEDPEFADDEIGFRPVRALER